MMMALGVAVLILWAFLQVKRGAKLTYDNLLGAALVGIPSGIIFSRLLHVVDGSQNIRLISRNPATIIGGEGLTIYGAILGAALGVWIYCRLNKLNFGYLADVITPGIILAQVLGRVGCTINGCCYGTTATNLPWALIYTNPNSFAPIGTPTQPTVVYEIHVPVLLFAVIMILPQQVQAGRRAVLVLPGHVFRLAHRHRRAARRAGKFYRLACLRHPHRAGRGAVHRHHRFNNMFLLIIRLVRQARSRPETTEPTAAAQVESEA